MAAYSSFFLAMPKKFLVIPLFLFLTAGAFSQKSKVDSLGKLLEEETTDTGRVNLMWQKAKFMNIYNPDSALPIAQEALYLAQSINYEEGESRSLGILANSFMIIGNYPRALQLNFQKLKLEEKRNISRSLASVLMNIGIVYDYQEEYRQALAYYAKADSVINRYDVKDFKYNIALNFGDAYNKLNISDSAFVYFSKSKALADDGDKLGKSMTGLGHSFLKLGSYQQSLINYQNGIAFLRASNDDEFLCEATLGLANLYKQMNKYDSSGYYATLSLSVAKKDGFLSQELDAAEFLAEHYKKIRNIDSAFACITYVHDLNDSVNSKSRIRQSQVITSDEQYRQMEIKQDQQLAQKKRLEQLQLLLIAIFIPLLFLLTLLLSRVKIHTRVIRLLGVLSLLFLFEYLTLLLHPTVAGLTNHSPVFEILIFVVLAAILIPAHHRMEHWLIHKLSHLRAHHESVKNKPPEAPLTDNKKSPA